MEPAMYLQVLDPANPDFKLSAQQFFDLADAYLLVRQQGNEDPATLMAGAQGVLLAREKEKKKSCFTVSAEERFMNQEVIDFVRAGLLV